MLELGLDIHLKYGRNCYFNFFSLDLLFIRIKNSIWQDLKPLLKSLLIHTNGQSVFLLRLILNVLTLRSFLFLFSEFEHKIIILVMRFILLQRIFKCCIIFKCCTGPFFSSKKKNRHFGTV